MRYQIFIGESRETMVRLAIVASIQEALTMLARINYPHTCIRVVMISPLTEDCENDRQPKLL